MVELIVVTHGTLAEALFESAQMLVGRQEHVRTFGLCLGDSIDTLKEQVAAAIGEASKEREVLVLTDMLSGSPFNLVGALSMQYEFQHLTGINFPVFIELLSARDEQGAAELVEWAVTVGKETLLDSKKYLEEVI